MSSDILLNRIRCLLRCSINEKNRTDSAYFDHAFELRRLLRVGSARARAGKTGGVHLYGRFGQGSYGHVLRQSGGADRQLCGRVVHRGLAGGKDTLIAVANDAWTSFDLNLSDEVVNLGAIKSPNLEALLASQPDFVIGSCNTQADIDLEPTLTAAGITVAYFDVQNFADYLNMLSVCTALTGKPELYEQYGAVLQARIDAAIARQDGSHPTVLCVRATGTSVKVRGSRDNLLGEMAAELGCMNVADSETSLLDNLSMEAIIRSQPEYIFVVVQGADPTEAEALLESTLLSNPAWSTLNAVQEGRYHVLDNALYNLKPNARWGEAYEKLSQILYP